MWDRKQTLSRKYRNKLMQYINLQQLQEVPKDWYKFWLFTLVTVCGFDSAFLLNSQNRIMCDTQLQVKHWRIYVHVSCLRGRAVPKHAAATHTHTLTHTLTTESTTKLHATISMLSTTLLMGLHWATSPINCEEITQDGLHLQLRSKLLVP